MNWKPVKRDDGSIDPYHIKSGPWTIAGVGTAELYKKPFQLFLGKQSIDFFATADEAKAQAEYLEVTQA